ncbi:purine nucleoside phosphorylase LACC1 [Synchiropus picturatus]
MAAALLLDLVHGCCASPRGLSVTDARVFLLRGKHERDLNEAGSARVLDCESTAEGLFRLKQILDQLDLTSVQVVTSPRGRERLRRYLSLLFTDVYDFSFLVECASCSGHAHPDRPAQVEPDAEKEVAEYLHKLPPLKGPVSVLTSSLIPDLFGHGFSCRTGGVTDIATLSALNLFSSRQRRDPPAVVQENQRRLALHAGFHPRPLLMLKVEHANRVWVLGRDEPERFDAMVTDRAGVVLAAPGADCIPILLADPVTRVVGVAHAGWRGTLMGVAVATVEAMVTEFGCRVQDLLVVLGPSVGPCCFRLERDRALDFHPACVADPGSERPHVDIRLQNRILLQRGGVLPERIHDDTASDRAGVTLCTSCHPERFFSRVRDGPNFGTQVGFLWIKERPEPERPAGGAAS